MTETTATKTFTCAACHETFPQGWTDEQAIKEFEAHFGYTPSAGDMSAPVCDDCYKKIMEFNEGEVQ
jgi:NAD-dependent SIR2 family protein deacetylase